MALDTKGPFRLLSHVQSSLHGLQCVDLVECAASGRLYIDKNTLLTSCTPEGRIACAAALHELDLHFSVINAHNVVKMEFHLLQGERLHLYHEYCNRGDLLEIIQQEIRLQVAGVTPQASFVTTSTDSGRRFIFFSILQGVNALHSAGVAHMDLSLENVFVTDSGVVKVGDLGHALRFRSDKPNVRISQVAKEAYAAPELLSHNEIDDARCADAWSLGVILWTLCTKQALLHRASLESDRVFCQMVEHGTTTTLQETDLLSNIPASCIDLLVGLLDVNPRTRISVAAALQHPWVRQETATPKQHPRRMSIGHVMKKKSEALIKINQHLAEKALLARPNSAEIALDLTRITLRSRNLA
ncbi:putative protein kinase [Plasmopara halstedii]